MEMRGHDFFLQREPQRGSVLLTVIFVMTILMLVGGYLLNFSSTELMIGDYYRDATEAYYLAEAGLQKALSLLKEDLNYKWGSRWLQFLSRSHPLGNGTFRVSLQDLGSNRVMITSTGYVGNVNQQITAEVLAAKAHQVLFRALNIRDGDLFIDGTVNGDIYVGGNLTIGDFSEIHGNVEAVGSVTGQNRVNGAVEEYSEPMSFPVIDEEQYLADAVGEGNYYEGNFEQEELLLNGIVFVEGNVIVEYISGDGLLFAMGDVMVEGGRVYRGSGGIPTIITKGTFIVKDSFRDIQIDAVIFADKFLCIGDGAEFKGCIVAGYANMGEGFLLRYDEKLLAGHNYPLPGAESEEVHLKVLKWSHPDD